MRSLLTLSLAVSCLVLAGSAPAAAAPPDPVAAADPVVEVIAVPSYEPLCRVDLAILACEVDVASLVSLEASSVERGSVGALLSPAMPDVVARVAIAGRLPSNRTPALSRASLPRLAWSSVLGVLAIV